MKLWRSPLCFVLWCLCLQAALGQEWPQRPIKWIVPADPGSAADVSARAVADRLGPILKQPVLIENRPGASGALAARAAARAPADGYTWMYSSSAMAVSMRTMAAPGFDVLTDFTHVACLNRVDFTLVVHPDAGFRDVQSLLAQARRAPGGLSYGSGGIGTLGHLGTELLLSGAGTAAVHIPYRGGPALVHSLLTREIAFAMPVTPVVLKQVKANRLQALAVTGPERNPQLPDVPTLAEAGVPGVVIVAFWGVAVPAGTPRAIVSTVHDALREVMTSAEVRDRAESLGTGVRMVGGEQCLEDFRAEIAFTERMMRVLRLQPQ